MAEERRLLASLDNDERCSAAVWKMEGGTNEEIAAKLGRSVRTVTRTLRLIRSSWEKKITS